jgi:hypothetical protein
MLAMSVGPAYAASKGGLVQLSRVCACAWAKDNIQVNAILPGFIATDMAKRYLQNPSVSERILSRTPTGRTGTPDDSAGIAIFLASHASDFVTGAAIPVDGGFSFSFRYGERGLKFTLRRLMHSVGARLKFSRRQSMTCNNPFINLSAKNYSAEVSGKRLSRTFGVNWH